ncbi:hypothetical protein [Pistricoccus aurantiacus]|uniref:Uncharacterized protein n=1 Tax=Pistricoccus aurantiacus TaxID=1883414 RepID=A0A5B8SZF5_9GAMM|nr:hypothetical protein [Pistricoccus aurantiacus]QEA40178.1 hypothetical protein FGL86_14545 [Pistricoccus aurantiacus]
MSDHLASRGRQCSRWWLAGLLVGCLLPASLVQASVPRLSVRIVHACLLAPAAILAQSRRRALRRRCSLRRDNFPPDSLPLRLPSPIGWFTPDSAQPSIGHDVLSRRGPPCSAEG